MKLVSSSSRGVAVVVVLILNTLVFECEGFHLTSVISVEAAQLLVLFSKAVCAYSDLKS